QACPTRPDRRDAGRPLERARARGAAVGRGSIRPGRSGRRVIPTAPIRIRNRLAEIILAALEKPEAHRELAALGGSDAAPDWLEGNGLACRPLVRARALSALAALAGRTPRPRRSLRTRCQLYWGPGPSWPRPRSGGAARRCARKEIS